MVFHKLLHYKQGAISYLTTEKQLLLKINISTETCPKNLLKERNPQTTKIC
jgi:hypothetical protein